MHLARPPVIKGRRFLGLPTVTGRIVCSFGPNTIVVSEEGSEVVSVSTDSLIKTGLDAAKRARFFPHCCIWDDERILAKMDELGFNRIKDRKEGYDIYFPSKGRGSLFNTVSGMPVARHPFLALPLSTRPESSAEGEVLAIRLTSWARVDKGCIINGQLLFRLSSAAPLNCLWGRWDPHGHYSRRSDVNTKADIQLEDLDPETNYLFRSSLDNELQVASPVECAVLSASQLESDAIVGSLILKNCRHVVRQALAEQVRRNFVGSYQTDFGVDSDDD